MPSSPVWDSRKQGRKIKLHLESLEENGNDSCSADSFSSMISNVSFYTENGIQTDRLQDKNRSKPTITVRSCCLYHPHLLPPSDEIVRVTYASVPRLSLPENMGMVRQGHKCPGFWGTEMKKKKPSGARGQGVVTWVEQCFPRGESLRWPSVKW